ncbi:AraC family transcriptional regulator [Dysgonomonas sp. 520]|uniref:helix-turn-helix domain-containing protein n=1 Tax=Dysgonomonas sp. 520 TaxID=2302931 RepID=UPI0013D6F4C2|nr:helix-turn-helix domain-containing protein [Dysgonomonas sp. 520]NDW08391.1 AraC family transcriptional regulator [Dysgonomonas sp. 520]
MMDYEKFELDDRKLPIRFLNLKKDEKCTVEQSESGIVLLTEGRLNFSIPMYGEKNVSSGKLFFLPSGGVLSMSTLEKSSIIFVDICEENYLFGKQYFDKPEECEDQGNEYIIPILNINEGVSGYIQSLLVYRNNSVNDRCLLEIKAKELVCIIKAFYKEKDFVRLFSMFLTNDLNFSQQVHRLSQNIRNVRQLAEKMNYSYSGFNKRFRKVFGVSAYLWLRNKRANTVYYELYHTNKSLKQISSDNKFCTLSHFNEFCYKVLGGSPRQIRNKRRDTPSAKKETSVTLKVTDVSFFKAFTMQR